MPQCGICLALALLTVGLVATTDTRADAGPEIRLTRVDSNCTYYATFQSHNQKVVQNENGIFMTYLVDYEDVAPWPGYWKLLRSTDGGESFEVLYTSPKVGSKAPCIETDEHPSPVQRRDPEEQPLPVPQVPGQRGLPKSDDHEDQLRRQRQVLHVL
jgi:hypothetical protein